MNIKDIFLFSTVLTLLLITRKSWLPSTPLEDVPLYLNDIDYWLLNITILPKLLSNISPPDALKGTVIASPSRESPNYYYHWIRE
jgi:hypothetical protein